MRVPASSGEDDRFRRVLRQAVPEIRAAARNLSCLRAAGASRHSAWRCRSGSSEKLFQKDLLLRELKAIEPGLGVASKLLFSEHHLSHAASAFYPSPFEEAAVLTHRRRRRMEHDRRRHGPGQPDQHRQGDPLSAFARPAVFGLHLLHGLQGQRRRIQGDGPRALRRAEVCPDHPRPSDRPEARRQLPHRAGLFRLLHRPDDDQRATSTRFSAARRARRRIRITQREMDLAASIQAVTEEVVLRLSALACPRNRDAEPVPGRRRGAELRRQRQAAARRRIREYLDSARGRRRRRRDRRGAREPITCIAANRSRVEQDRPTA